MAVRVSPYLLASIDWSQPYTDPIRGSSSRCSPPRAPIIPADARLAARARRLAGSGLIHRYADKALFLPLQTCPVYCRFCTRSYAIGPDTAGVDKLELGKTPDSWAPVFAYVAAHPEIEDIVISGGDAYQLAPKNITLIGEALLAIRTCGACALRPKAWP